jgi:hypothetical protein
MIMRQPAFFFLYGPHPASIVCTDPLSAGEAATIKSHLETFFSQYTENELTLGDFFTPVLHMARVHTLLP